MIRATLYQMSRSVILENIKCCHDVRKLILPCKMKRALYYRKMRRDILKFLTANKNKSFSIYQISTALLANVTPIHVRRCLRWIVQEQMTQYDNGCHSRCCTFLVYILQDNSWAVYSTAPQAGVSHEIFRVLMRMRYKARKISYLTSLCDEMYGGQHSDERLTELNRMCREDQIIRIEYDNTLKLKQFVPGQYFPPNVNPRHRTTRYSLNSYLGTETRNGKRVSLFDTKY